MVSIFIALQIFLLLIFVIFGVLLIEQLKSAEHLNYSLLIAVLCGIAASGIFLADSTINLLVTEQVLKGQIRTLLESMSLLFFSYFYYFWYQYYGTLVLVAPLNIKRQMLRLLNLIQTSFFLFYLLGLYPLLASFISQLLPLDIIIAFFTNYQVPPPPGRIQTVISHTTYLVGIVVYGSVAYLIIANNFIKLKKSTYFELVAIIFLFFVNGISFLNNILITYNFYPPETTDPLFLIIIFLFLLALIFQIINYILVSPPDIRMSSLLFEYYTKNNSFFSKHSIFQDLEQQQSIIEKKEFLEIKRQLKIIGLEILLILLQSSESDSYASSISQALGVSKARISYNLKVLESFGLIQRNLVVLATDQRYRGIKIVEKGYLFLFELRKDLITKF